MSIYFSRSHHLDRRADSLAHYIESDGKPDDLLTSKALATRLGISIKWLDNAVLAGFGPPFSKLGVLRVYRRDAVIAWLHDRANHFAADHAEPKRAPCPQLVTA